MSRLTCPEYIAPCTPRFDDQADDSLRRAERAEKTLRDRRGTEGRLREGVRGLKRRAERAEKEKADAILRAKKEKEKADAKKMLSSLRRVGSRRVGERRAEGSGRRWTPLRPREPVLRPRSLS